jgi:hypothetical protein
VELLGYSCDFSARKGTDTSRSGTRSLASVPFLLRFFKVVKVCGRYLSVNGYHFSRQQTLIAKRAARNVPGLLSAKQTIPKKID